MGLGVADWRVREGCTHDASVDSAGGHQRRAGFGEVCRALATGRARYQRAIAGVRALDYESDWAQERSNGASVNQGWDSVPGE